MIIKDYYPKYVVTLNELDTGAAMALAELCFDTLMEEGVKAKIALEAGVLIACCQW